MAPIDEPCVASVEQGQEKACKVPVGEVLPGNAAELRELANAAFLKGEDKEATRLYTMAIDTLTRHLAMDQNGRAKKDDLASLNKSSDGLLAKLLSNRSFTHSRLGDLAAAIEDAETCTQTDSTFEKGHLRLLAALEAVGAPLSQQLEACASGVDACPESETLITRKWKLKKAVASLPSTAEDKSSAATSDAELVADVRRRADDTLDPRRAMAAGDLGSLLATGARGVQKDATEAERYLRIGAEGGDLAALRNLGHLLLEQGRAAEAAEAFREGGDAGDEEAKEVFQRLVHEASIQEKQAREKLEALAAEGDVRAIELLSELGGHGGA